MKTSLCSNCEYLGNAVFPVVDYRNEENGEIKPKFIGFSDRPNGPSTNNPSRHCNHEKLKNSLVYEFLEHDIPCQYFKERKWERPKTCGECGLKTCRYTDGTFLCSGYPFSSSRKSTDTACVNGKVECGAQMEMLF